MQRLQQTALLLFLAVLFAGCAAPPNIIARRNQSTFQSPIQKISLLTRRNTSPAEAALDAQLTAELRQLGVAVVSRDDSDYVIAASAEVNWSTVLESQGDEVWLYPPPPASPYHLPYEVRYEERILPEPPTQREHHIPTYGIRLKLYPSSELKQGRFNAVWDGYVDAGIQPKTELIPVMLRNLCAHLGQDFVGHVKFKQ